MGYRLASGNRGFMAPRTKDAPLSVFVFLRKTSPTPVAPASLISKLQAHLGYNVPWGVLPGPSHSPFPPPIWGICNALCNTVRFEETSKQVFACILHVSPVLRASGWLHRQNMRYVYTRVLPVWFYMILLLVIPYIYVRVASIADIIVKCKIGML